MAAVGPSGVKVGVGVGDGGVGVPAGRARRRRRSRTPANGRPAKRSQRLASQTIDRDVAAGEAIGQVGGREQRRRRDQHDAELHRREHRHPQLRHVAEHQQHPVAPDDAEIAQAVREPVGRRRQLAEREPRLAAVLRHDVQRQPVPRRDPIEPVERPVELAELGPRELALRPRIVAAACEQQVAGSLEGGAVAHGRECRRWGRCNCTARAVQLDGAARAVGAAVGAIATARLVHLDAGGRAVGRVAGALARRGSSNRTARPCKCTARLVHLDAAPRAIARRGPCNCTRRTKGVAKRTCTRTAEDPACVPPGPRVRPPPRPVTASKQT